MEGTIGQLLCRLSGRMELAKTYRFRVSYLAHSLHAVSKVYGLLKSGGDHALNILISPNLRIIYIGVMISQYKHIRVM